MKFNSSPNGIPDTLMHKNVDAHGTNNDLEATLARNLYYKEQVTGVPSKYSYYVNGKEFDGFALVDAKGPGYANPIKSTWSDEPKSTYKTDPETGEVKRVKRGLIETAEDQVKAVRATGADTPIQWHIAEKYTFDTLRDKQDSGEFSAEIELIHTPPN